MPWLASGRSVRGKSHLATGLPCQDASAVASLGDGDVLVACVADGGGTAALSHIGSNLAVTLTRSALIQLAPRFRETGERKLAEEALAAFWGALVNDIRRCIEAEAAQLKTSSGHFGTTLLAAIATRDRLAMMQVGDGFIVYAQRVEASAALGASTAAGQPEGTARAPNPFVLGFKPERGEFVGEVTWITSSNWSSDFRHRVVDTPVDFVCLSSDGLEKVAIVQRDQTPHPGYFEFMRSRLAPGATAADAAKLVGSVLLNPELDKRTDDDKSVVVARWREPS